MAIPFFIFFVVCFLTTVKDPWIRFSAIFLLAASFISAAGQVYLGK